MLSSKMEHKNLLKTEHQCTFVYNLNFSNYYPLWGVFSALGLVSNIFTIFFMHSEVGLAKCDSYGNLTNIKILKKKKF